MRIMKLGPGTLYRGGKKLADVLEVEIQFPDIPETNWRISTQSTKRSIRKFERLKKEENSK
jgi:hypothetical protein